MSQTWTIVTTNSAFTGEIKKEDTSTNWEYSLDGGNSWTSLPSGFAFTAQFYLGANNKYDCSGGTLQPDGSYDGEVTYATTADTTTNWKATKSGNKRKVA
jgi:hypothetical protein